MGVHNKRASLYFRGFCRRLCVAWASDPTRAVLNPGTGEVATASEILVAVLAAHVLNESLVFSFGSRLRIRWRTDARNPIKFQI